MDSWPASTDGLQQEGSASADQPEVEEKLADERGEIAGVTLQPDDPAPVPEPFLLLPGDGLLLVRGLDRTVDGIDQLNLKISYANREAHGCLGEGLSAAIGGALVSFWPALAEAIQQLASVVAREGPRDLRLPWQETTQLVRLFRTDDGVGVGLLAMEGGSSDSDHAP